ncbi:MAG: chitinase [Frondihabitans sp.]|nr:chitinase [Frondihabitans sp.]
MTQLHTAPRFLLGHVGHSLGAPSSALLASPPEAVVADVRLVDAAGAVTLIRPGEPVDLPAWGPSVYRRIDLSAIAAAGSYRCEATVAGSTVRSEAFEVAEHRLQTATIADVTAYFRSQRSSGEIDRKDRDARFYDDTSGATVDARGGWLDASGDTSKFLSHLTYTRMMSPQQIPLCAWALLAAVDELDRQHGDWRTSQRVRLRDEGLHGADFLVRFQDPAAFFYTGIFDALTKRLDERVITAPLQDSVRTQRWQAAYRHGGGLAIAALARASVAGVSGDFDSVTYFSAAERGFRHLEAHNREYLFDGVETVLDDYCALLAATELAASSRRLGRDPGDFDEAARIRALGLIARLRFDEHGLAFLEGDGEGRPYFHAAESGLPVIALLRFAEVAAESPTAEDETAQHAIATALTLVEGIVGRTDAVPNPFGLPRQRVQPAFGRAVDSFFFPHENETGYWWQGENANLASLSYAATLAGRLGSCPEPLRVRLRDLAADTLDWILGRNPFDVCMLQGRGRGAPDYTAEYQNSPGGILNGITSGFTDESGIAFLPDDAPEGDDWRWAEQWIPHTGWFALAVSAAP